MTAKKECAPNVALLLLFRTDIAGLVRGCKTRLHNVPRLREKRSGEPEKKMRDGNVNAGRRRNDSASKRSTISIK